MQEIAKVESTKNQTATLILDKKDECSKCGMCLFPKGAQVIKIEAQNGLGAKEGDTVIIERTEAGKLTAFTLVFLVPLLLILLSSLIALEVMQKELWSLWLSLISCTFWFIILSVIDKWLGVKLKAQTQIVKILNDNKENENGFN